MINQREDARGDKDTRKELEPTDLDQTEESEWDIRTSGMLQRIRPFDMDWMDSQSIPNMIPNLLESITTNSNQKPNTWIFMLTLQQIWSALKTDPRE